MVNFYLLLPEIFFFVSVLFLFFFNLSSFNKTVKYSVKEFDISINVTIFISLITLFLYFNNLSHNYIIFNDSYLSNNITFLFKLIILLVYIIFLMFFSKNFAENFIRGNEVVFIFSMYIFSLFLLLGANDFIWFYVVIELNSICMFGILMLRRKNTASGETIIKYFVVSALITSVLLYSIVLNYCFTGSLNFCDIEYYYSKNYDISYLAAPLLTFSMILLKTGVAPFHIWTYDVYTNLDYPTLFYLLMFPKIALLAIFLNFYKIFFIVLFAVLPMFNFIIFLTAFYGILFAIFRDKIKDILIFSSVSNLSFFYVGFLLNNFESYIYTIYFLIIYILNIVGVFMIFSNLKSWSTGKEFTSISDLAGLYKINPVMTLILASFMFSLAGLPPFPGFIYKFYFLAILWKNGSYLLFFMFMSIYVVSAFYYIRIIKLLFANRKTYWVFLKPLTKTQAILISFIFILNVLSIFLQNFFIVLLINLFI